MHIDKYKQPDGWYKSLDGCDYEYAEDFIQADIIEHCLCGQPDLNLKFIHDGLLIIDNWNSLLDYKKKKEDAIKIFGNESSMQFFFYWADKMGFSEHGSVIPGWLTDEGRELLDDLNILLKEDKNEKD